MKLHVARLTDGQDLRQSIIAFAQSVGLKSGVIVSAVGSLQVAVVRMPGASPDKQDIRQYDGPFEIVSLTGTIAGDGGVHLHLSVSDTESQVAGGHLKDGSLVHTTVELAILEDETQTFTRAVDPTTGFDELNVA
jgi:predicted DNA-binding protein with PD1-like motif